MSKDTQLNWSDKEWQEPSYLPKQASDVGSVDGLTGLLGALQALQVVYQSAHWLSSGSEFYGDHLLYERLYGGVSGEIDPLAEKILGLSPGSQLNPRNLMFKMASCCAVYNSFLEPSFSTDDPTTKARKLLAVESHVGTLINFYIQNLNASGSMTNGLEDLLQGMASTHEGFKYLLQQRVGSNKTASVYKYKR